jgi:hypothetical protein
MCILMDYGAMQVLARRGVAAGYDGTVEFESDL